MFRNEMERDFDTSFSELNDVLRQLVSSVHRILGDDAIGIYLQGSFAVGDYDEHSDVDFIVATTGEFTDGQLGDLQSMHRRLFNLGPEWARHLEGSYFPAVVLRDYNLAGSDLWYLDNGTDSLVRSNHCNSIVVRWILRESGVVLSGPEPSTLIDPIPVEVLRRAVLSSINSSGRLVLEAPDWIRNRFYQGFIVLQWCRKLHDLYTGTVGSKRAGADWAKRRLDASWGGLIDRAWDCRPNPAVSVKQPPDEADFQRTLEFVSEVMKTANEFARAQGLPDGEED